MKWVRDNLSWSLVSASPPGEGVFRESETDLVVTLLGTSCLILWGESLQNPVARFIGPVISLACSGTSTMSELTSKMPYAFGTTSREGFQFFLAYKGGLAGAANIRHRQVSWQRPPSTWGAHPSGWMKTTQKKGVGACDLNWLRKLTK